MHLKQYGEYAYWSCIHELVKQRTFFYSKYDVIVALEPLPISHSELELVYSLYKVWQPQYSLMVTVVDDVL